MLNSRTKGNRGENIAVQFIEHNGFIVVERNYFKKWGEIDIIAKKDNVLHFFEVKSVEVKDFQHNASNSKYYRPEDNVDGWKVKHLRKTIETYLCEKGGGMEDNFQFHVICVYMNTFTRRAHVEWLKNMIL